MADDLFPQASVEMERLFVTGLFQCPVGSRMLLLAADDMAWVLPVPAGHELEPPAQWARVGEATWLLYGARVMGDRVLTRIRRREGPGFTALWSNEKTLESYRAVELGEDGDDDPAYNTKNIWGIE